jgi:hypothetical protein
MHGFDVLVAHVFESFQNGESLRINDRFFWSDDDFCFHAREKNFAKKSARARAIFKIEKNLRGNRKQAT